MQQSSAILLEALGINQITKMQTKKISTWNARFAFCKKMS